MQSSIHNIICEINETLNGVFKGASIYGIAQLVTRENKTEPVINERSVSFDDAYSLQVYHRLLEYGIAYRAGFGDQQNTINTFSLSAIVFNNKKETKLEPDQIAMIIQGQLANINIKGVRILPARVILNSQTVFNTEYRGVDYSLGDNFSLMQINYTVELTINGRCPALCPEDFINKTL